MGESKPEILIIGIDQFFFNENWSGELSYHSGYPLKKSAAIGLVANNIIKDLCLKKLHVKALISNSNSIGVYAKEKNTGFLNDGSYFYGAIYEEPTKRLDYKFKDTLNRIEKGKARFEYAENINSETIDYIDELLKYCKVNGIYVIGFLPPYAPSINDTMEKRGNNYRYISQIPSEVEKVFSTYNFEFYNYTDVRKLECDDTFFIDGFHGGEIVYLRMFADMIKQKSELSNYCSLDTLRNLDMNRISTLQLQ